MAIMRRARSAHRHINRAYFGLKLQGKAFNLPNTSGRSLSKEFVVNPDVSYHMNQEACPTAILDDSSVSEVMTKPSIPLVESVEAFFWGLKDNPFGHSPVKPYADAPLNNQKIHGLPPFFPDSSQNQTAPSDGNASSVGSQMSFNNPQPSIVIHRLPVSRTQVLKN